MVQIGGLLQDLPSCFRRFGQCKRKQIRIIRFEFQNPFRSHDLLITMQEFPGGQSALGMTVLGPRIGEVQIDLSDLVMVKYFRDGFGIHADKIQIGQRRFKLLHFLDGAKKDRGILFDPDIIDLGM